MRYPKVSFLVLNWNGLSFTRKCIKSLLKTPYPNFEIVLLDNGSENNESEKIQKLFGGKIKLIKNKRNIGYAAGMNLAFSHADGDFIMVLNNDMEFKGDWLMPLVKRLISDERIAMCQPKVKDLKNRKYFEYAAAAGGFIDMLGYPFARGRIFSQVEKDIGQYDTETIVSWAGVFLAKKKILKKIGFLDDMYFTYAEDIDLCWRVYGNGYRIVYVPSSIVYHYGGGIIGKRPTKKMFFIHRNHLILVLKNWPSKLLLFILLPRMALDVLSIMYYLANGYVNFAFSIILAYMSLISKLPEVINARNKVNRIVRMRAFKKMPIYKGSIVWNYFIRKRRTFKEVMEKENIVYGY